MGYFKYFIAGLDTSYKSCRNVSSGFFLNITKFECDSFFRVFKIVNSKTIGETIVAFELEVYNNQNAFIYSRMSYTCTFK